MRLRRARRVRLVRACLAAALVSGVLTGSPPTAAAAPRHKMRWYSCEGRAPLEAGCTFTTRFRGWPFRDKPFPTIHLRSWSTPKDPLHGVPQVCIPGSVCATDSLHGTLTVQVVGRTRGWVRASSTWADSVPIKRYDGFSYGSNLSWSKWEHLTVTVTVTGLEDGLPPTGPWQARIGIATPL